MIVKLSNKQRLKHHTKLELPNKISKFWMQNNENGYKYLRILGYKRKNNDYNESLSFTIIFFMVISFMTIFLLLPTVNMLTVNLFSLSLIVQPIFATEYDPIEKKGFSYVSTSSDDNISILNNKTTNFINDTVILDDQSEGITFDRRHNIIYVVNTLSDNVSVINTNNNRVIKTIQVGDEPYRTAFDRAHNKLYVINGLSDDVSVINTNNHRVIGTIPVG